MCDVNRLIYRFILYKCSSDNINWIIELLSQITCVTDLKINTPLILFGRSLGIRYKLGWYIIYAFVSWDVRYYQWISLMHFLISHQQGWRFMRLEVCHLHSRRSIVVARRSCRTKAVSFDRQITWDVDLVENVLLLKLYSINDI